MTIRSLTTCFMLFSAIPLSTISLIAIPLTASAQSQPIGATLQPAPTSSSSWIDNIRQQPDSRQLTIRQTAGARTQSSTVVYPARTAMRSLDTRPRDYSHLAMDPRFLPQEVRYSGPHQPGTIIVDSANKYLYLITSSGSAKRYGVGVGKEGFGWRGREVVTNKREWPDWRPPSDMIAREREMGRILPTHMAGGPENPLGARALYLGSTLYRIHGTNAPWTIGQEVSSGCIRMRNEDVIDLYGRVRIGSTVVVL